MDSLLKKEHLFECILSALFVIYLIIGCTTKDYKHSQTLYLKIILLLILNLSIYDNKTLFIKTLK